jgi:hypothetical protein
VQGVDIIQALKENLNLDNLDLRGNLLPSKWFQKDHYFATKLSRETPSITTRMDQIRKAKLDPEAKKYVGKLRDMDVRMIYFYLFKDIYLSLSLFVLLLFLKSNFPSLHYSP